MKKVHLFVALLVLAVAMPTYAQKSKRKRSCGFSGHMQHLSQENPQVYEVFAHTNSLVKQHRQVRQRTARAMIQQVRVIPVVVHVVYNTDAENITDEQIHAQIRILNEDFRRQAETRGFNTHPDGADTMIQFRLAEVNPKGKATTGINRVKTKFTSFSFDDKVKSKKVAKAWDTSRYLNMWSCNLSDSLLGYAQFPGTGKARNDGVVILFSAFGEGGKSLPPYNLGRTATHEVGHWLGLRHIWGDGGCTVDDGFEDTPRSDNPNFGSPSHPLVHCGSDDMFENYMDYTEDGAMNIFTKEQSEHMNSVLDTLRSNLCTWDAFSSNK